jgi:nucleotide-binding universal stress UspA family protein
MYKQILCPVDGSDTSARGMLEAIGLAKAVNAKLRFLYVVDTFYPILDGMEASNIAEVINVLREHGKRVLKEAQEAAAAQGVEVDSETLETFSVRVAELIVEHAKKWPADLIVMGTHGRRGFGHLIMGSDAEAVIRTSPVPVLSVRLIHQ